MNDFSLLRERFPFLTILEHAGTSYIGIVQNSDDKFVTFYDLSSLRTDDEKKRFLLLGETWWNESNRLLPISIFLSGHMTQFRPYLKTFSLKETNLVEGQMTSLGNLIKRRSKRRHIQLLRKM